MTVILRQHINIEQEITLHPAWLGKISGLSAEKMLRNQKKFYLFVLRAGENESDYYATYTHPDGTIRHQPFVITVMPEGWYCEQGGGAGPFIDASIDDIIHLIIHCAKDECEPFTNFGKSW